MNQPAELTSADAVEWCDYFHPGRAWKPSKGSAPMAYATVERDLSGPQIVGVTIMEFNEIHRAAAVLVERGLSAALDANMMKEWAATGAASGSRYHEWLYAAPADAWARAILATVREVSK